MWFWLSAVWALHWGCIIGILGLLGALLLMSHEQQLHAKERKRDRRLRDEFEAYARLDARLHDNDLRALGRRVCKLVSKKSAFHRVAMLTQDADGRLCVAASVGMEEATIQALHAWSDRVAEENAAGEGEGQGGGVRIGEKSFAVVLGKDSADIGCGRAIVVPLWTAAGQMRGALTVCADRLMTLKRQTVEETIAPLEALAMKLGRAMEDAGLTERLERAEKLAGLGLLASGVAQALENPLTSVLGFAELITETSREPRVRTDAEAIVQEARRIQHTVENLMNFGRSGPPIDEPVGMEELVRDVAAECEGKLESRGVGLVLEIGDNLPMVRGCEDRLRQVLEHLLNNAAQAMASVAGDRQREHEIRVSLIRDATAVQLIVSDTGPGFREPERVFDPFHPARQPGEGAGVGLSICYGIVREHGGEIHAYNLHPYGAAVVVELPFEKSLGQEHAGMMREVA